MLFSQIILLLQKKKTRHLYPQEQARLNKTKWLNEKKEEHAKKKSLGQNRTNRIIQLIKKFQKLFPLGYISADLRLFLHIAFFPDFCPPPPPSTSRGDSS